MGKIEKIVRHYLLNEAKKVRTDRNNMLIGDGSYHVPYKVFDFSEYPQISYTVQESSTTESVYVIYLNKKNLETCRTRFSNHSCNYYDNLINGNTATKEEILYHLGLIRRKFVYKTYPFIRTKNVSKKRMYEFEEIDLTLEEVYNLGIGADISEFYGKRTKGENIIILDNTIHNRTSDMYGHYVYEKI